MERIKVFTNEAKVHSQVATLENLLERSIQCEISLNVKDVSDNIQFDATTEEIDKMRSTGVNILKRQGGYWLPVI